MRIPMKTRIISVILTLSMLLPFCFSFTPKAQAIAPALAAQQVGAALASVLIANGYKLDSIGLTPGDVTDNLNAFWQQYRSFMGVEDFVLDSGGTAQRYDISIQGGLIFLSDHGADLVDGFLDWIAKDISSVGTAIGERHQLEGTTDFINGVPITYSFFVEHAHFRGETYKLGTVFPVNSVITFGDLSFRSVVQTQDDGNFLCSFVFNDDVVNSTVVPYSPKGVFFYSDEDRCTSYVAFYQHSSFWNYYFSFVDCDLSLFSSVTSSDYSFGITVPEAVTLPDTSTMTEEQSLVIDTGIQADNIEGMLDKILQSVAAGTLTVTAAIENTTTGDGGADPKPDEGSLSKQLSTIISLLGGSILLKLSGIFDKVAQIPNAIQTGVKSMTDGITGALTGTWDGITDTVSGIWESIKSIPSVIGKAVTDLLTGIKTLVVDLVVPRAFLKSQKCLKIKDMVL